MKIGVVGVGVVGSAVLQAFSSQNETVGFDIAGQYADPRNFNEIASSCDICFVCAPSPTVQMRQRADAIWQICNGLSALNFKGVVVLKSTLLPGTTAELQKTFGNLRIVHNPEFLTARNAYEDFITQKVVLLSGAEIDRDLVILAYRELFPGVLFFETESTAITELAKYMRNNYLAVKLAFANEFYALCASIGIDYNEVKRAMLSQGGVEIEHWSVPGHDGKLGFSGACLPKDIRAMISFMSEKGIRDFVLASAEISNQQVRPHDCFCNEMEPEKCTSDLN